MNDSICEFLRKYPMYSASIFYELERDSICIMITKYGETRALHRIGYYNFTKDPNLVWNTLEKEINKLYDFEENK